MFLALLACQLAFVAANPFHKYPYVFLLDIGNEEIKKTNTEQIRLSVPGGSLALRYPAVGNGDTIAHVRVSGIDFGTDLKANILDGGPGYKYVVIVLMGNRGAPYDAVLTVETVSDKDIDESPSRDVSNGYNYYKVGVDDNTGVEISKGSPYNVVESASDENVSSEDTNDEPYPSKVGTTKGQITQQSSNVFAYANKAANYENSDEDASDEKDTDEEQYTTNNRYNKYGPNDELADHSAQITHQSSNAYTYGNSATDDDEAADDNVDVSNVQDENDDLYAVNDRTINAKQSSDIYSYDNRGSAYDDKGDFARNEINSDEEEVDETRYYPNVKTAHVQEENSNVYSYVNRASDNENDEDDTSSFKDTKGQLYGSIDENENTQLKQKIYSKYSLASQVNDLEEEDDDKLKDKYIYYNKKYFNEQVEKGQNYALGDQDDDLSNEAESLQFNDDYGNDDTIEGDKQAESFQGVDNRAYEKLQPVMPLRVFDGMRIYPQYAVPFALPSGNSVSRLDDGAESDSLVNENSDVRKYRDSNNNNYESDDASAIES